MAPHRAGTVTLPDSAFPITSPLPSGCCSLLSNPLPEVLLTPALWPSWVRVKAAPLANPLRLQAGQERGQALQPGKRAFSKLQMRLLQATGLAAGCKLAASRSQLSGGRGVPSRYGSRVENPPSSPATLCPACQRWGGMALGHPRAAQRAEVPPGSLPGSAATGLCPATRYGRTVRRAEGPRRQPARHRHVPREHLCAPVQTLSLAGGLSTGGQQRWGKKWLKSLGPAVQAASFGTARTPDCSVTLHPAPRTREVKLHAASKANLAGLVLLHFLGSPLKQRQPTRSCRNVNSTSKRRCVPLPNQYRPKPADTRCWLRGRAETQRPRFPPTPSSAASPEPAAPAASHTPADGHKPPAAHQPPPPQQSPLSPLQPMPGMQTALRLEGTSSKRDAQLFFFFFKRRCSCNVPPPPPSCLKAGHPGWRVSAGRISDHLRPRPCGTASPAGSLHPRGQDGLLGAGTWGGGFWPERVFLPSLGALPWQPCACKGSGWHLPSERSKLRPVRNKVGCGSQASGLILKDFLCMERTWCWCGFWWWWFAFFERPGYLQVTYNIRAALFPQPNMAGWSRAGSRKPVNAMVGGFLQRKWEGRKIFP